MPHASSRLKPTLLLLIALGPGAHTRAETLFHCTDADGIAVFSDLPCTREVPADATQLSIRMHNAIADSGLDAADLRHLQRIATRSSGTRGGVVAGAPDQARERRCRGARDALAAHRIRARRPHAGSLLARGRELRAAVREHCH